jgi:hypothetical protein
VGRHHGVYDNTPVSGVGLEELLSKSLRDVGIPNSWESGSHKVSTDITLADGSTLSVKSGTIARAYDSGVLEFNGSRLGQSQRSVGAMLASLRANSAQGYLCLSRKTYEWKKAVASGGTKRYYLLAFPAHLLDYGTARSWVQVQGGENPLWRLTKPRGAICSAEIRGAMSHQLWTKIDIGYLVANNLMPPPVVIEVPGPASSL